MAILDVFLPVVDEFFKRYDLLGVRIVLLGVTVGNRNRSLICDEGQISACHTSLVDSSKVMRHCIILVRIYQNPAAVSEN